jgi:hypothetical protein
MSYSQNSDETTPLLQEDHPFSPKTQQVASACQSLEATSLETYECNGDYISIGAKNNKKETPREIFIETNSSQTVETLKTYGLLKGTTPTAVAIAHIGEYRRKLKAQTNYGVQSEHAGRKDEICAEAQAALISLEEEELKVDFTNAAARRNFTQKVIKILNDAVETNKVDSDSIFHREGRLEKHLINAINYLEEDFERIFLQRAPEVGKSSSVAGAYFSRADQLHFDSMSKDKYHPIHLTKKIKDNEVLDFLASHYEETAQTKPTITNNQFRLLGIIGNSKESQFLLKKRNFLRRVYHASKSTVPMLWHFLTQPIKDVGYYLKKQENILLDNAFEPFVANLEHASPPSKTAQDISFEELEGASHDTEESVSAEEPVSALQHGAQTPSDVANLSDATWLKAEHEINLKDQYDNFLAQVLYIVRNNLKRFDTLSKHHEVIALGVSSAGIVTLLVLFKAGLINGALKSFIETFFNASKLNEFEKVWNTLGAMSHASKLSSMPNTSLQELLNTIEDDINTPLKLTIEISSQIAFFSNLITTANPGLSRADLVKAKNFFGMISKHGARFNTVKNQNAQANESLIIETQKAVENSIAILNKQLHYLNQSKKPASFFGSLLLLPLKPIFAILKPLVSFSAATVASIRFKSVAPFQIASQEFSDKFRSSAKHLAMMALDFTNATLNGICNIAAFAIRTPIKVMFTIVRKTIGTINDLSVGALNLFLSKKISSDKTFLKAVNKKWSQLERFVVDKIIVRASNQVIYTINDLLKPLRNALHPNSPIERLRTVTKTLEVCKRYFEYQLHFIQNQTSKKDDELIRLLTEKIQEISKLTNDVLALCEKCKNALKNDNPAKQRTRLSDLRVELLGKFTTFNEKIMDIDEAIDKYHVLDKKNLTIAVKFDKQRDTLLHIINTLPELKPEPEPNLEPQPTKKHKP